jgi:hypothetical protein
MLLADPKLPRQIPRRVRETRGLRIAQVVEAKASEKSVSRDFRSRLQKQRSEEWLSFCALLSFQYLPGANLLCPAWGLIPFLF